MKVLLATDCSDQATAAAQFLRELGFNAPIELTLITALGDPYGSNPDSTQHWFPELLRQERSRAENHQADLARMLVDRCQSIAQVCRPGHPVKVILGEAESLGCDLIVIGAQGHSFLGRLLIGSVSDSVATHAKCSVLIVRPHDSEGEQAPTAGKPNRLVIGYDSSHASREAIAEMVELDWNPDTAFELVSVAPIYDYLLGNGLSTAAIANEEEIFNEMKQGSREMKHQLADHFANTESTVIHDQRVGDAIAEQAKKKKADLIVVGDSGHSLLDDFLLGSTTKYVLRHAECSVWISRHHRVNVDAANEESTSNAAG